MSHQSKVVSDFQRAYENDCRARLVILLKECLSIHAIEPDASFNLKLHEHPSQPWPWAPGVVREVEVDFFADAHMPNNNITIGHDGERDGCRMSTLDGTNVLQFCAADQAPHGASISTKSGYAYNINAHILGEITYGGMDSMLYKLEQLEKDCRIAVMKTNNGRCTVSQAVVLAAVVAPDDRSDALKKRIMDDHYDFACLRELLFKGRVIMVKDPHTPAYNLGKITVAVSELHEALAAQGEAVAQQISMQGQMMEEQISTLKQQLSMGVQDQVASRIWDTLQNADCYSSAEASQKAREMMVTWGILSPLQIPYIDESHLHELTGDMKPVPQKAVQKALAKLWLLVQSE